MFFEANKDLDQSGTVYIMRFKFREMDGLVYKIGVCKGKRKAIDRMLEVLRSYWKNEMYIPECDIKRFKQTDGIFKKEADLHYHFKKYQYMPDRKHDGSTELFYGIDEEYLLDVYARCLNGEQLREIDQYTRIDDDRVDKD